LVRVDKVRVADSQLGEIPRELKDLLSDCGAGFLRQEEKNVVYKGVRSWRMYLPLERPKDAPFHLFNVSGHKLAPRKVGQCVDSNLFRVM
jgi:hypothetical protein